MLLRVPVHFADEIVKALFVDLDIGDLFQVYPEWATIRAVPAPMKAGSCSFHNGLTAHGAHAITADRTIGELARDNEFAVDPVIMASLENLELARAGGELPPELRAFRVVGEVEHAGEHLGTLYIDVKAPQRPPAVLRPIGTDRLSQLLHVGGGRGLVQDPPDDDGQLLAGVRHGGRVRGRCDVARVLGEPAQARADVERAALSGQLLASLVQQGFHGHFESPWVLMYADTASSRRSLALRQW